jgi:hypothetical protein
VTHMVNIHIESSCLNGTKGFRGNSVCGVQPINWPSSNNECGKGKGSSDNKTVI